MTKGRFGGPKPKKGNREGASTGERAGKASSSAVNLDDEPQFQRAPGSPLSPLLLTLLFRSAAGQHAALARIEAYYESRGGAYLTLDQASQQRLCHNYEAFNCPIAIVTKWLDCMRAIHCALQPPEDVDIDLRGGQRRGFDDGVAKKAWWRPFCNAEENELLAYLQDLGCLGGKDVAHGPPPPTYLITSLASQASSSLPHERLHFLYFFAPAYRNAVRQAYGLLSDRARKVIEADLTMRGYAPHVWMDEFQAYVALDPAEFGKSVRDECTAVRRALLAEQRTLWSAMVSSPPAQQEATL